MKKIDVSGVCAEYVLDSKNFQHARASVLMACSTCLYNLFTYCHFDDREDSIVFRALEGNYDSEKMIHDKIQNLRRLKADGK